MITLEDLRQALPLDVLLYLVDEEGAGVLTPEGQARAEAALREAWARWKATSPSATPSPSPPSPRC